MERMLVVVFDNETKAYEGKSALSQLAAEGSITLYGGAVVTKHADGTASVLEFDGLVGPLGTLAGTAIGSLVGLLGGPVGLSVGAVTGMTVGALYDLDNVGVGEDFIEDVSSYLTPNKVAIVAEVDEDWTTPVDTRMEDIGGIVFRRALREVRKDLRDEDIAAMKADAAQFKEEMSKANATRKAKLQKKIDELQAKIDAQQSKAKERRAAFEARQKAKAEVLKKNAQAAGRAIKELAKTPV
jgi:uncharacterized membrane protein